MKLFISYSTDDINLVNQLAEALKQYAEVFYWDKDKEHGEDAWETIYHWIDNADLVIAVITDKTVSRAMSVGQEIGRATAKNKKVIPVVGKDIPQSAIGCLGGITKISLSETEPSDYIKSIEKIVLSCQAQYGSECRKNVEFLNFRDHRIDVIKRDDTPVPLNEETRGVLHLAPINGFEDDSKGFKILFGKHSTLKPIAVSVWNDPKPDSKGFYIPSWLLNTSTCTSYLHVFRTGAIEAVSTGILRSDEKRIASIYYEETLIEALTNYLDFYKEVGFTSPICLSLCFLSVKDFTMYVGNKYNVFNEVQPISVEDLIFQPITIHNLNENPATILKPLFDQVWQACGFVESWNYDDKDNWSNKWDR